MPPPNVELARSDAVFVGQVVKLSIEKRTEEPGYQRSVVVCELDTTERFKGIEAKIGRVVVITSLHGSACGFPFEIGQDYLVYASFHHGELETHLCRRTKPLVATRPIVAEPVIDESGRKEVVELRSLAK